MNVALVQVSRPFSEGDEARQARIVNMVKRTAGRDLVVPPEPCYVGYFRFDAYTEYAGHTAGSTLTLDCVTTMGYAAS